MPAPWRWRPTRRWPGRSERSDYLLTYPFGCTEQRIALASSELALLPFAAIAGAEGLPQRVGADVAAALRAIRRRSMRTGWSGSGRIRAVW